MRSLRAGQTGYLLEGLSPSRSYQYWESGNRQMYRETPKTMGFHHSSPQVATPFRQGGTPGFCPSLLLHRTFSCLDLYVSIIPKYMLHIPFHIQIAKTDTSG